MSSDPPRTRQLPRGHEIRNGIEYGWTGRICPACEGEGETDEARICAICSGTGEQWGEIKEAPMNDDPPYVSPPAKSYRLYTLLPGQSRASIIEKLWQVANAAQKAKAVLFFDLKKMVNDGPEFNQAVFDVAHKLDIVLGELDLELEREKQILEASKQLADDMDRENVAKVRAAAAIEAGKRPWSQRLMKETRAMDEEPFTNGDLVELITGGPIMVVRYIVDKYASFHTGREIGIHCDWIDTVGRPQHASYLAHELRKLKKEP